MAVCVSCGHQLGIGRFCINCGHPVDAPAPPAHHPATTPAPDDWRTGTAERPAIRVPPTPHPPGGSRHRRRRSLLSWLLVALALLLVAVIGISLLMGDDDPVATDRGNPPPTSPEPPDSTRPSPKTTEPSPTDSPTEPGKPTDVATTAEASVPATAPPNQDVDGNLVRYEARNMLDGVPDTCWRMPGDGTGEEITIRLAEPTVLSEVGLINGYAKVAVANGRELDWYAGNRRVTAVEWAFDDGTTVSQDLENTTSMQTIEVDDVTTETVRLRLVAVSPPGSGPARRNFTPISDLTLVGSPV